MMGFHNNNNIASSTDLWLVSRAGKCPPYLGAGRKMSSIFRRYNYTNLSKRFIQSVLEIPCFPLDRKHVNLLKVNVICPKNSQKFPFTSINYMTNALLHVLLSEAQLRDFVSQDL